jgi:DinB family protein
VTPVERKQLIAQYKGGYDQVSKSLEAFSEDELTSHPIPGKWSACEIVHHLADSETVSGIRLKRLLVEDHPLIQGYDQEAFAIRLKYNMREVGPALDAFRSARANTAQLLDSMAEEDWKREGTHSESGSYTAEDWLQIYAEHAHNHAAQIRRLKDSLAETSRA